MGQSLTQIYIHCTFCTYFREEVLDAELRENVIPYMAGIMKNLGAPALQIGGWMEHIHILFRMPKDKALMSILQQVKKDSSKFIKKQGDQYKNFKWQAGYFGVSVSPPGLERVISYIKNQEQHHRRRSYRDEVLEAAKAAGIEFDEHTLFD